MRSLQIMLNKKTRTQLCTFFDIKTMEKLYFQIGDGIIDTQALHQFSQTILHAKQTRAGTLHQQSQSLDQLAAMRQQEDNAHQLVVMGQTIVADCVLGTCCLPTVEDTIVGFANAQGTMEVHKQTCARIAELQQQPTQAICEVQWNTHSYPLDVQLRIEASTQPGLKDQLLQIMAREQLVILQSMHEKTQQQVTLFTTKIGIKRPTAMQKILQQLEQVPGVIHINPPVILQKEPIGYVHSPRG